jgi:superfamily II DNA/RNA helicase
MSFKKLNPELKAVLAQQGIVEPTLLQKNIISKIKGGLDVYGIAADGKGKTTALIIGVLQRINYEAKGDNPRALIFVEDKEACLRLEEEFKKYLRFSEIRIALVYEERIINHQKDEIYAGADIVIATPKRLSKLYFLNGINLTELQMIVIEDAEFLNKGSFHTDIDRITESVEKSQRIVFAQTKDKKIARLDDLFMQRAQVVKG